MKEAYLMLFASYLALVSLALECDTGGGHGNQKELMCPGDPNFCYTTHCKYSHCPDRACDTAKEIMCPGPCDPQSHELYWADTCIPLEDANGCMNHCPLALEHCYGLWHSTGIEHTNCPGKINSDGCKEPDYCHPGSKYSFNSNKMLSS